MSTAANPRHPDNHPQSDEPQVPAESAGPVAKDSLAAESLQQGGAFAADDPSAAPLGVSGSKSTLNTTDTSAAVPLNPASSGDAREKATAQGAGPDEKGPGGLKYPDALGGQPNLSGVTTSEGHYYGGASSGGSGTVGASQPAGASDFGASTTSSSDGPDSSKISSSGGGAAANTSSTSSSTQAGTAAGVRPYVDSAPNYAARVSGAIESKGVGQPKGTNLTESGDVPPEKKTFTGDVGGPKDPGRVAEQGFTKINANTDAAGGGVSRDREGKTDVGGQYGVLEGERV